MYVYNFSSIFFLFFVGQSGTEFFVCLFYLCIDLFLFVGLGCFCEVSWNFISVYFQPMTASELSVHVTGDLYYYGLCFYTQF